MREPRSRSSLLTDGALAVVVLVALAVAFACGRRMALGQGATPLAEGAGWYHIDVKTSAGEVRIDPTGIRVKEVARR